MQQQAVQPPAVAVAVQLSRARSAAFSHHQRLLQGSSSRQHRVGANSPVLVVLGMVRGQQAIQQASWGQLGCGVCLKAWLQQAMAATFKAPAASRQPAAPSAVSRVGPKSSRPQEQQAAGASHPTARHLLRLLQPSKHPLTVGLMHPRQQAKQHGRLQ